MEEYAFAIETMYQTKREHKVEHNTPPIMMVGTLMVSTKVW